MQVPHRYRIAHGSLMESKMKLFFFLTLSMEWRRVIDDCPLPETLNSFGAFFYTAVMSDLLMSSAGSVLNVMAAENVARKSKMSKICEKFRTGLSVDTFEICIQNISHSFRTSRCRGWNSNVLLLKFSFRIST